MFPLVRRYSSPYAKGSDSVEDDKAVQRGFVPSHVKTFPGLPFIKTETPGVHRRRCIKEVKIMLGNLYIFGKNRPSDMALFGGPTSNVWGRDFISISPRTAQEPL